MPLQRSAGCAHTLTPSDTPRCDMRPRRPAAHQGPLHLDAARGRAGPEGGPGPRRPLVATAPRHVLPARPSPAALGSSACGRPTRQKQRPSAPALLVASPSVTSLQKSSRISPAGHGPRPGLRATSRVRNRHSAVGPPVIAGTSPPSERQHRAAPIKSKGPRGGGKSWIRPPLRQTVPDVCRFLPHFLENG